MAAVVDVLDVANFFLIASDNEENQDGISNMKIQKLLYYAQGFHLALFDAPLFSSAIKAWTHGPVCPNVYHEYKKYGKNPIPVPTKFSYKVFSKEQIDLLNEVYEVFGQFSAGKLRRMTHEEPTWENHESDASEIPLDELKEYFKTRIN